MRLSLHLWFTSVIVSAQAIVCAGLQASEQKWTDWTKWSPREEIAPSFRMAPQAGRNGGTALSISISEAYQFGAWKHRIKLVRPGKQYRFAAWYKTEAVPHEARSVIPRIEWLNDQGRQLRPPEYALGQREQDGWKHVLLSTTAPSNASSVEIQLGFGFVSNAEILWDDFSFAEETSPPNRIVRAATVYHRPRATKSAAESLEQFCQLALGAAHQKPDIICLPEGATVVGTGKSYFEVGESIPGPSTKRLGEVARTLNSYIVAGIYERDEPALYNTAVLIGRDGKLVGKYRKTHLPREEWEAGITPGDEYPVFDTDFGKVGLLICWDVQFPEPARAMALRGAEILLLPIWGGSEVLARARAIENHVFLVSSSFDMKTFIVNPEGKVLAEASREQPVVTAELRLDDQIFQPWLGDMKYRTWRERRGDIPVELPLR